MTPAESKALIQNDGSVDFDSCSGRLVDFTSDQPSRHSLPDVSPVLPVNEKRLDDVACSLPPVESDTKKVRVPGASAPSIDVAGFLNSWPRLFLKVGGELSQFLHSVLSKEPYLRNDEGTPNNFLWPMPPPYPEAFHEGAAKSLWRKRRLCLQVLTLSWLFLGRPSACPQCIRIGQRLSAKQWKIVRLLEELSEDSNSLSFVDAEGMGRAAGKVESQDEDLGCLHRAYASLIGSSYGSSKHFPKKPCTVVSEPEFCKGRFGRVVSEGTVSSHVAAKPIEAARLQFGPAPKFDPVPYFDELTAMMYERPQNFTDFSCYDFPSVSIRASRVEQLELYKKLAACNRLVLLEADEVCPRLASGLFAVPKDLERDRLIMDSRPPNSAETGLSTWVTCMACPDNVAGIEIREDEDLLLSGQDIKDFYYQFSIGRARAARNLLVGELEPHEVAFVFGECSDVNLDKPRFVGLNTLAMGDICACEFAEGSHLGLLLSCGAMRKEEILRLRCPPPRGLLSIGIVIDDLVMLERISKSSGPFDSTKFSLADDRMSLALGAYETAGLPTNPKKEFRNASQASFWGICVDGKAGIMRPNPQRVWPLCLITLRVCLLGICTISLLESLAGSWISVFTVRRRTLSCMEVIFEAIHCGAPSNGVVRLSKMLKDELLTYCVMATLVCVNLRARTLPCIRATDASDWGGAAVVASVSVNIAREALRSSLKKGAWSKLLPPSKAWLKTKGCLDPNSELPGEDVYDCHPFWEYVARVPEYRELWRKPRVRSVHINVGEMHAHLHEESRVASNHSSVRIPYALDSQVCLGALTKGRAASPVLNSLLRRSLGVMLGSDLYAGYIYFPSKLNRSDGPTRNAMPDPADLDLPIWWLAVEEGKYEMFDHWMATVQSSAGVDPPADLDRLLYREPFLPLNGKPERKARMKSKVDASVPLRKAGVSVKGTAPCPCDRWCAVSGSEASDPPLVGTSCKGEGQTDEVDAQPSEKSDLGDSALLCPEAIRILQTFSKRQFLWPKGSDGLFSKPGALDLYSGRAGVAKKLVRLGCPFVLCFEWKRSSSENLLEESNRTKIRRLLILKAFKLYGSAIICSSFSRAITPAVRSKRYPRGIRFMRRSVKKKVQTSMQKCWPYAGYLRSTIGLRIPTLLFFGSSRVISCTEILILH